MQLDCSIIIVSWNVRELLRACLKSLPAACGPALRTEVLVVDNASTDGSAAMVEEEFPQVRLGEANLALGHREDERSYLVAAQMLLALGVSRVVLLSNNPDKARQLRSFGVTVTARVPTGVHLSAANSRYLATKAQRGAHTLDVQLSTG